MRFTPEEAATAFNFDVSSLTAALRRGQVTLDSDGTLDMMFAQAFQRTLSDEFTRLFSDDFVEFGRKLVFVQAVTDEALQGVEPLGLGLLDARSLGLRVGGRQFYQTNDVDQWIAAHDIEVVDKVSMVGVLERDIDTRAERALADAYLLGDARTQHAVKNHLTRNLALTA